MVGSNDAIDLYKVMAGLDVKAKAPTGLAGVSVRLGNKSRRVLIFSVWVDSSQLRDVTYSDLDKDKANTTQEVIDLLSERAFNTEGGVTSG